MKIPSSFTHPQVQGRSNHGDGGHMSPALLETGDSVPRSSLTHRQYLRSRSLICYLDLSELTFSQSQGESSLGRVFHELHICHYSCSFIHLLLCSLADWGKIHPIKKQRSIMSSFFPPNTHNKYVLCRDDTIHTIKFPCYDLTYCNAASGLYSACICD